MEKQQALTLLGLNEHYSAADLTSAVAVKKQLLQQKRDAAPTEALKAKFEMMLLQVDEAAAVLQTASTASPQAKSNSPLSQTKLADLPSMAAGDAEQLALQAGQVLAGRYEVKELLGQGGMGAVYRAFDKSMSRDIALKVLLPSLIKNDTARERFLNEARLSSSLSHPNIVNVFDVQNEGDLYFLTMELLEGQDLRQVMENQKRAGRPFDVEEVKLYISAISAALAEAHKFTVHRDIKPENIWLTEEGQLKLMDFGIAQVQSASQRTQTGAAMGTAYYMAPEQLKGQKDIDGRADQYAVAVLAYELLTGEVPAGVIEPVAQLRKDVPKVMAQTIMQALQSRPENRFLDINSFNDAFQSGKATKVGKTKSTNYVSNSAQSKWPMVAGFIAVLVLGGGLFDTGIVTVDDVKKLLPVSKEIIAAQKAEVAKAQGEIKVLKQRLDNGRRQLDSDVRDAERNKDKNLIALTQWQALTERVIFEGNFITELEGELSMAESLLRENALEQAKLSVDKVRDGYKQLWDNFVAGEQVSTLSPTVAALRREWQSKPNSTNWPVSQSTEALYQEAQQHEIDGQLHSAQPLLEQLDKGYRALLAANDDIGSINTELTQAQTGWQKLASSKQLTDVPEIITLQTEEKTHRTALAAAADLSAITQAMQGLQTQIETYTSLTASVQNLAQAEKSAQSAQAAFEKSRQGYPLPANATAVKAAEYFTQARTALQNKNWVAAGKGFADTKQHFEQAQQQEVKQRAVIDEARAAEAEAKRKAEAERKVEAEKQRIARLPITATPEVVTIPGKSFKMSKYTTTFAQYDAYAEAAGVNKPSDSGWGRGNRPVINVSWHEAVAYAKWLSEKTGKRYRLPTEEEWEYAARAGTTTEYYWGNSIGSGNANCDGCGSRWDSKQTAPVGSFAPNGFGLHDMAGNVLQWTQSCHKHLGCGLRMVRGGSWDADPFYLRSAYSGGGTASSRNNSYGFRLVQD